jgi:hypothetical protein
MCIIPAIFNQDFVLVVKPLGISVKKEAGEVVETSRCRYVINPQATKEIKNGPGTSNGAQKWGPNIFGIFKFLSF